MMSKPPKNLFATFEDKGFNEIKYVRADTVNLPKNIAIALAFYVCALVWKNIGVIIDGRWGALMLLTAIVWLFIAIIFMIKSHFKGEWA
jgi:hypothetical protein